MILPFDDGFSMPADWGLHARCLMAWPTRAEAWGKHLDAAREIVAELATTIAQFEPVSMIAKPKNVAEVSLLTGGGVSQISLAHDDCWMRDIGPNFITDKTGHVAGVTWKWNAWGGKFADFSRDAAVAETLLEELNMRRYAGTLVLEGGAINTDGEGTLLTTESVLLNANRNPGKSRKEIEEQLIQMLGIRHIVWLGAGLQDDPGGGHVGNLARFIGPNVVLAAVASDPADPNHKVCQDNLQRLRAAHDAKGRELEIVEIEQPRPRFDANGRRLALSYTSFYLANGAVILPAFEDGQADKRAFDIFTRVFSKCEIIQLPAMDLAEGGGGIHALCLPQPAGEPAK